MNFANAFLKVAHRNRYYWICIFPREHFRDRNGNLKKKKVLTNSKHSLLKVIYKIFPPITGVCLENTALWKPTS